MQPLRLLLVSCVKKKKEKRKKKKRKEKRKRKTLLVCSTFYFGFCSRPDRRQPEQNGTKVSLEGGKLRHDGLHLLLVGVELLERLLKLGLLGLQCLVLLANFLQLEPATSNSGVRTMFINMGLGKKKKKKTGKPDLFVVLNLPFLQELAILLLVLLNQGRKLLLLLCKEILVRLPLLGKGQPLLLEHRSLLVKLEVFLLDIVKEAINRPNDLALGSGEVPRGNLVRRARGHRDSPRGHRGRGGVCCPLGGNRDGGLHAAGGGRGSGSGGGLAWSRGFLGRTSGSSSRGGNGGTGPGGLGGQITGNGREGPKIVVEVGPRGATKGDQLAAMKQASVTPPHRRRGSTELRGAPGGGG